MRKGPDKVQKCSNNIVVRINFCASKKYQTRVDFIFLLQTKTLQKKKNISNSKNRTEARLADLCRFSLFQFHTSYQIGQKVKRTHFQENSNRRHLHSAKRRQLEVHIFTIKGQPSNGQITSCLQLSIESKAKFEETIMVPFLFFLVAYTSSSGTAWQQSVMTPQPWQSSGMLNGQIQKKPTNDELWRKVCLRFTQCFYMHQFFYIKAHSHYCVCICGRQLHFHREIENFLSLR